MNSAAITSTSLNAEIRSAPGVQRVEASEASVTQSAADIVTVSGSSAQTALNGAVQAERPRRPRTDAFTRLQRHLPLPAFDFTQLVTQLILDDTLRMNKASEVFAVTHPSGLADRYSLPDGTDVTIKTAKGLHIPQDAASVSAFRPRAMPGGTGFERQVLPTKVNADRTVEIDNLDGTLTVLDTNDLSLRES